MRRLPFLFSAFLFLLPPISSAKELPKIAVWDLDPRNTPEAYARELTSFMVSEINKLKKYEVYSQDNVRTLAGWTAERMKLGCTDIRCLTALGQMDIAMLISGSVGKIGDRFTISLNLFDTQNAKAENAVSKTCESEGQLIELIQASVRELLREPPAKPIAARAERPASEERTTSGEYRDPTTGMEFVLVKGGCYEMMDTFGDGDKIGKPVHRVCVDDFYLGKYEVTQDQWRKVMHTNPSFFKNCGGNCPVEQVSWNDAQVFIPRLNRDYGKRYRLPNEAEWEYAARSGGKRERWSGTSSEVELGQYAWYRDNSPPRTHPVGEKRPNGLGLYDMSGNVWEWCADLHWENYNRDSPRKYPEGPGKQSLRGGSWGMDPWNVRAATRTRDFPEGRGGDIGFRLAAPVR